jgi:hypothetical protein
MVVALLVLMLFTAAGVAFIAVTKSEKQIAGNQRSSSQAMYAAESGLSEALARMNNPNDPAYIGTSTPSPGWGCYVVAANGASALDPDRANEAADGLDNDGNGLVDDSGEHYPEILSAQAALGHRAEYPYVRLSMRTQGGAFVRFGDADHDPLTPPVENMNVGLPVLDLSAKGAQGNANKVVEAVAYRHPLVEAISTVWAGGKLKMNGNAFLIDGHDHDIDAPFDTIAGAAPVPGIMTEGVTTDAGMSLGQEDNVLGSGGMGSVVQSPVSYDFNEIWATVQPMADVTLPAGTSLSSSSPDIGTNATPKLTVAQGNLTINGTWTGSGILVVNGNLSMAGGSQFTGIVVCLGDVSLAGGGPADVARIVGSVIYQGTIVDNSSYGGSARVYYSSAAVNNANILGRYQIAWWHER